LADQTVRATAAELVASVLEEARRIVQGQRPDREPSGPAYEQAVAAEADLVVRRRALDLLNDGDMQASRALRAAWRLAKEG
jgi:hypothetical protein